MNLSEINKGEIFTITGSPNEYFQKEDKRCLNLSKGCYEALTETVDEPMKVSKHNGVDIRSKFKWREPQYMSWLKGAKELASRRKDVT